MTQPATTVQPFRVVRRVDAVIKFLQSRAFTVCVITGLVLAGIAPVVALALAIAVWSASDPAAGAALLVPAVGAITWAVIGTCILSFVVGAALLRPINRLALAIERFAHGNLEQPVPPSRTDFLSRVITELEAMRLSLRTNEDTRQRTQEALEYEIQSRTETLRRRADQLKTINNVGQRMVELRSLDDLLPFIAEQLVESFNYDNVNVFLFDAAPETVVVRGTAGSLGAIPVGTSFKVGERGIVANVAATRRPHLANDVSIEPRYVMLDELKATAAELAVPIRRGDELLGVLDIESQTKNAFDDADLNTAQTLADLIAVAIDNARLYEQTRELGVTEERNRLAREIHDTIAQGLTALIMQLEMAEETLDSDSARSRVAIRRGLTLARQNLDEARRSVENLRARSLQQSRLPEAIRSLLEQHGRDAGFYYTFNQSGDGDVPPAVANGVYRIVQEAVNNIVRHAQASEVDVTLERVGSMLRLVVQDDGQGFEPGPTEASPLGHFGIIGMHERANLLGGNLQISTAPAEGTRIELEVPLRAWDQI